MSESPWERTPLGKILSVLGTGERFGTKALLAPLLLSPRKQDELYNSDSNVYAGDVLRKSKALDFLPEDGPLGINARSLGYGAGGFALGGLVDPLTYVGLGGVNKTGRALSMAGKLPETMAGQGAKGARSLLRIGVGTSPLMVDIPGQNKLFKFADYLREGHTLKDLATRVAMPPKVRQAYLSGELTNKFFSGVLGAADMGDRTINRTAQVFNVGMGVPVWLWRAHKKLKSRLMGAAMGRTTTSWSELEEPIQEAVDALYTYQKNIGMKVTREEVDDHVRRSVLDSLTSNPDLFMETTKKGYRVTKRATKVSGKTFEEKVGARLIENIREMSGLPPTWGGPGSPGDTEWVRNLRDAAVHVRTMTETIHRQEEDILARRLPALMADPTVAYMPSIRSREADRIIDKRVRERFKAYRKGGKLGSLPTTFNKHNLTRGYRYIVPDVLESMKGKLDRDFEMVLSSGKKSKVTRTINLYQRLKAMGGSAPLDETTLSTVGKMLDNWVNWREAIERGKLVPKPDFMLTADEVTSLLPPMSSIEQSDYIAQHGIKFGKDLLVHPGEIKQFNVTDPTTLIASRGMASDRAMLSKQFFDDMIKKGHARIRKDIPKGEFRDWHEVTTEQALNGFYVHKDVAEWLNKQLDIEHRYPGAINDVVKLLEKATGWLRTWTLAPFPTYYVRNVVGLAWNYYLGSDSSLDSIRALRESTAAYRAMNRGKGKEFLIDLGKGRKVSAQDLWVGLARRNSLGVGFFSHVDPENLQRSMKEMVSVGTEDPRRFLAKFYKEKGFVRRFNKPSSFSEAAQLAAKTGLSRDSIIVHTGFKLNTMMDDRFRFAHAIQRARMGWGLDDISNSVKKYFFNYHDLSSEERYVFRNIIPFYTWSRKNIPLQLEALITRPNKVARVGSFLHGSDSPGEDKSEHFLNDWMMKRFPTRVRTGKDGRAQYFLWKNWLPLADILDLVNITEWATAGLTPFAKVPLELMANINFFSRREIDHLDADVIKGRVGETTKMYGIRLPNRVAHVLRSYRATNMWHDIIDNPQDLDMMTMIMKHGLGRVYPFDPNRGLMEFKKKIEELKREERRSMYSAVSKGDMDALEIIRKESEQQILDEYARRGLLR